VTAPLLELSGLSIAFGGLKAVQDVSLVVQPGTLTALIGPNGAGKTTLFALMSGFLRPDAGTVRFDGRDITGHPPHLNARAGMTRTFQIVQPFAAQTVRENIAVGAHLHAGPGRIVRARHLKSSVSFGFRPAPERSCNSPDSSTSSSSAAATPAPRPRWPRRAWAAPRCC